ncbi:MAG: CRISPR-associated endonuclease Cas3'', partial [Pseudonocardiaceae bacterium]
MSRRQLWAKSPPRGHATGELLIAHLTAALEAMDELQRRVGQVATVPEPFWRWARLAILLHDAGKVADGFQIMVGNGDRPAEPWGERHEVYSLGFVARVLADSDRDDLLWVATGVASHHRPFTSPNDGRIALFSYYDEVDPDEFAGHFGSTDSDQAAELQDWLATTARAHGLLPGAGGSVRTGGGLGQDAYRLFEELRDQWDEPSGTGGLTAVLLQGAVTLADHVSSAHGRLCTEPPLTPEYPGQLRARLRERDAEVLPHQVRAARVDGHLLLRAPTGSGKTEAALLWAQTQIRALHRSTG